MIKFIYIQLIICLVITIYQKDKKLFFKGECNLLYVADTLFDSEIAPGYNMTDARFAVPYILVSDSNDIIIRKEE